MSCNGVDMAASRRPVFPIVLQRYIVAGVVMSQFNMEAASVFFRPAFLLVAVLIVGIATRGLSCSSGLLLLEGLTVNLQELLHGKCRESRDISL